MLSVKKVAFKMIPLSLVLVMISFLFFSGVLAQFTLINLTSSIIDIDGENWGYGYGHGYGGGYGWDGGGFTGYRITGDDLGSYSYGYGFGYIGEGYDYQGEFGNIGDDIFYDHDTELFTIINPTPNSFLSLLKKGILGIINPSEDDLADGMFVSGDLDIYLGNDDLSHSDSFFENLSGGVFISDGTIFTSDEPVDFGGFVANNQVDFSDLPVGYGVANSSLDGYDPVLQFGLPSMRITLSEYITILMLLDDSYSTGTENSLKFWHKSSNDDWEELGDCEVQKGEMNEAEFTYCMFAVNSLSSFAVVKEVATYTISYSASVGGSISGSASQTVNSGSNGSTVTAVANSGYRFVRWSDNSTANPRIDSNVSDNISVSAIFERASVGSAVILPPPSTGSGSSEMTISMNQSGSLGQLSDGGVNYLTYIGSKASFSSKTSKGGSNYQNHSLTVKYLDLANNRVGLVIASTPQEVFLNLKETIQVDLDGDGIKDIEITFADVNVNRVELTVKPLVGVVKKTDEQEVKKDIVTPLIFTRDLKLGSTGEDVRALQKYLNSNSYLVAPSGAGSKDNETTFFGPLTQKALTLFQKAKNIATNNLGTLDLVTRKFFGYQEKGTTDFVFNRSLRLNMVHEDVRALQRYLNSNGFILADKGPGSPGNETNIFGPITQRALIRFQQANNITPAVGYFGPKTREFINK